MSFLDKVKNIMMIWTPAITHQKTGTMTTMFPHRVHHVLFQETEIETEMIPIKL